MDSGGCLLSGAFFPFANRRNDGTSEKSTTMHSQERKKKGELCGSVSQNTRTFLQGNDLLSSAKQDSFDVYGRTLEI